MKAPRMVIISSCAACLIAGFFAGCKGKEDEEKIRITVEQPGTKKAVKAEKPPEASREPAPETGKASAPAPAAAAAAEEAESGFSFKQVADGLDLTKHTKEEVKARWGTFRERQVVWRGEIYDVDIGRRGFKIYLREPNVPTRGRYNIVVTGTGQSATVSRLRRGQTIRVRGIMTKYDYGTTRRSAIVVLRDAQVL